MRILVAVSVGVGVLIVVGFAASMAGDTSPAPMTTTYQTGTAHIEVTGITQVPSSGDVTLSRGSAASAPNELFGNHNEIDLDYWEKDQPVFLWIHGDPSHPTADSAQARVTLPSGRLVAGAYDCGWSFQEVSEARVIGSLDCNMSDRNGQQAHVHATFTASAAASS